MAVLGTQIVATLIAVYGLFMTPLGWGWALFVWGYALAWFLVNDRVKLLAYRILDPVKPEPKSEAEAAADAKTPADPTAAIDKRAYGIYEERVQGVEDWEKAKREIQKAGSRG